jgi:hypothetical protein
MERDFDSPIIVGTQRSRQGLLMRISLTLALLAVCSIVLPYAEAASCVTQSKMAAAQRDALAQAARTIASQMQSGDVQALQANTIPAVAANFGGIAALVQDQKLLIEKATITIDDLYLLDASTDPQGSPRTDFFCGHPLVSMNFSNLPSGTYALVIVHATGVPHPQQITLILSKNVDKGGWMLAGVVARPMIELGHDGLWYWTSARNYAAQKMNWDAWLYYRVAAHLLDPIDLLSTPNLEKLQQETVKVRPAGLSGPGPMPLMAHGTTYALSAIDTTTAFDALDLDVHYVPDAAEASQLHDPPSARKQVLDIMTVMLQQHPELQQAFHGIWVHADQGTSSLFALELPMTDIAQESGLKANSASH